MKIKCCQQSEGPKEISTLTELEAVMQKVLAGPSVLEQLGITKRTLKFLTPKELKGLYIMLVSGMSEVMTQWDSIDGLKTSDGSTLHKPVTINVPGVGDCQYTGD